MTDELQQTFEKLRALAPKLNSATDEADRLVHRVDHFLAEECRAAVQCEVPVRYNEKGKPIVLLRYAHLNGRYCVCLTYTDGESRFVTRGWSECDRADKLAAFPLVPKLVTAVSKAVENQLSAATGVSETMDDLITLMGKPAASAPKTETPPAPSGPVVMLRAG